MDTQLEIAEYLKKGLIRRDNEVRKLFYEEKCK
jgi:hypothetical protein